MRLLKKEELDLITHLLKDKPNTKHWITELPTSMVEEMNDGGMGSIRFLSKLDNKRKMDYEIAVINLRDIDRNSFKHRTNY